MCLSYFSLTSEWCEEAVSRLLSTREYWLYQGNGLVDWSPSCDSLLKSWKLWKLKQTKDTLLVRVKFVIVPSNQYVGLLAKCWQQIEYYIQGRVQDLILGERSNYFEGGGYSRSSVPIFTMHLRTSLKFFLICGYILYKYVCGKKRNS